MKELEIDGKKYIKATEIAKDLGYTSDYVGQLCRASKVVATRVGRSWYVEEHSIHSHKKDRYRANQQQSKVAVAAYKKAQENVTATTRRAARSAVTHLPVHHYESDSTDLLPALKKFAQTREASQAKKTTETTVSIKPKQLRVHRSAIFDRQTSPATAVTVKATTGKRTFAPAEKPAIKFTGALTVTPAHDDRVGGVATSTHARQTIKKITTQSFRDRAALHPTTKPIATQKPAATKPKPKPAATPTKTPIAIQSDSSSEAIIQMQQTGVVRKTRYSWSLVTVVVTAVLLCLAALAPLVTHQVSYTKNAEPAIDWYIDLSAVTMMSWLLQNE
jgi:hypothetical protein